MAHGDHPGRRAARGGPRRSSPPCTAATALTATAAAPLDLRATAMAAVPGGGTLPGVTIDSYGVTVAGDRREALRRCEPPIIARVDEGRTWLDLRTVEAADNANLVAALRALAAPAPDPTA
ncbi:MAG: hypothetical protein R2749_00710 [Acidimicrobiales bacterium]